MSDLVNRLRGEYKLGEDGVRSFAKFVPLISFEAADKIEELEERLKLLNALEAAGVDCWDGYDAALEILKNE